MSKDDDKKGASSEAKVEKLRPQQPPPSVELDEAAFYKLKSARQEVQMAAQAMQALQMEAMHAREKVQQAQAAVMEMEKGLAEKLELTAPLSMYRLDDGSLSAVLNMPQQGPGPGGPPQGQ